MRKILIIFFAYLNWSDANSQNLQVGVQSGLHITFARIKYVDINEWEPAAFHFNLLGNIPVIERFSFQIEMGLSERRTFYSSTGVSHSDYRRYRLLQLEQGIMGKYCFTAETFSLYGLAGLSVGVALAGSEYQKGSAVGPVSWENTGPIDFDYFPYNRLSWSPTLGMNIQYQHGPGEFVLYTRVSRAAEKYCPGCGNVLEVRIMAGIGYFRNI